MKIIDTHFHLWDLQENYYPWLSGDKPTLVKGSEVLRRNYVVADLLRDIGDLDIVAGVHVQAEYDHRDPVGETRWLQRQADRPDTRGFPQGIVAEADFARPDIENVLEGHCSFANTRGIRFALHRRLEEVPSYDPLKDPVWLRGFSLLKKYGLSFDMQVFPRQIEAGVALIRANPDVMFMLTHLGMPMWDDAETRAVWREGIRRYAACPNVWVKISGFSSFAGFARDWGVKEMAPLADWVIDAFSPARCVTGSNYPVEGIVKPYREVWQNFFAYFSRFSEAEQEGFFWRNAAEFYRLAV